MWHSIHAVARSPGKLFQQPQLPLQMRFPLPGLPSQALNVLQTDHSTSFVQNWPAIEARMVGMITGLATSPSFPAGVALFNRHRQAQPTSVAGTETRHTWCPVVVDRAWLSDRKIARKIAVPTPRLPPICLLTRSSWATRSSLV